MGKAKTYFEQVPIAMAKRIAKEERRVPSYGPVTCAICGNLVKLEHCKINENGEAVHDKCYSAKYLRRRK